MKIWTAIKQWEYDRCTCKAWLAKDMWSRRYWLERRERGIKYIDLT